MHDIMRCNQSTRGFGRLLQRCVQCKFLCQTARSMQGKALEAHSALFSGDDAVLRAAGHTPDLLPLGHTCQQSACMIHALIDGVQRYIEDVARDKMCRQDPHCPPPPKRASGPGGHACGRQAKAC